MTTNKINVTAVDFSTSGNIDNGSTSSVNVLGSLPTNWDRGGMLVYSPTCVLMLGYSSGSSGYTRIYRCTDIVNYATWTAIDLPVQANWKYGGYGNGKILLAGPSLGGGYSTSLIYSTDDGVTWSTGSTLAFQSLGPPVYGNKWIMALGAPSASNNAFYQSTDGINWTLLQTNSQVPSSNYSLAYNSVIDRWLFCNGSGVPYLSTTNAGSAWTDISSNVGKTAGYGQYVEKVISSGNYFIVPFRDDTTSTFRQIKISTNGTTWTTIYTATTGLPRNGIGHDLNLVKDMGNGTVILQSGDITSMLVGTTFTYNVVPSISYNRTGDNLGVNNLQTFNTSTNYIIGVQTGTYTPIIRKPINISKLSADRYIDITASKTGATSVTKRLFIKKVQQTTSTYILYCNPGSFNLMSTLDGVVDPASFTNANAALIVTKDGLDQTGWTFTTTNDAGLTASISGSTLSITALTTSVDLAYANITASKAGEPSLLLKIAITKNKSGVISGINRGSSLSSIITNNNTALSIKFLNTGMVQIKYGTGSYGNLIPWFSPVNSVSPPGGSWWMNMTTTGDAFTTSAGSGWLALSTSREFIFDKTGSPAGTYTCNMTVQFGTTSTGGNISVSTGTLQIIIP